MVDPVMGRTHYRRHDPWGGAERRAPWADAEVVFRTVGTWQSESAPFAERACRRGGVAQATGHDADVPGETAAFPYDGYSVSSNWAPLLFGPGL